MAKIKFNFYNVYTTYYKNINETLQHFKCKLYFYKNLNIVDLEVSVFFYDITDKFLYIKCPWVQEEKDRIIDKLHSFIFKKYKNPITTSFFSKQIFNFKNYNNLFIFLIKF